MDVMWSPTLKWYIIHSVFTQQICINPNSNNTNKAPNKNLNTIIIHHIEYYNSPDIFSHTMVDPPTFPLAYNPNSSWFPKPAPNSVTSQIGCTTSVHCLKIRHSINIPYIRYNKVTVGLPELFLRLKLQTPPKLNTNPPQLIENINYRNKIHKWQTPKNYQ